MNPIGINILSQYVKNTTALMTYLKASNPAVVVVMDGHDLAQSIRRELPQTTVIHRAYNANDAHWETVTTPEAWLAAQKPFAANGVVVQCFNEPSPGDLEPFLTWLETLVRQTPSDMTLALPAFAVGNPSESDILNGKYDRLLKLVGGTRHWLMLHEYFRDNPIHEAPYLCGRYSYWQTRADDLGLPMPKFVIGEHGRDVGGGKNDGWKGAGWSDADYFKRLVDAQSVYDDGIPVCIYCWGTGANNDWLSFDIEDATDLQNHIIQYGKDHPMTQPPVYPVGANPSPKRIAVVAGLNLRSTPSGAILNVMPFHETVTVYAQPRIVSGGHPWVRVTEADGTQGWAADDQSENGGTSFSDVETPQVWTVKLDVPYVPQQGATANAKREDCGAACAVGVSRFAYEFGGYLDPVNFTVDDFAAKTSLASADTGLTSDQVAALLMGYGLKAVKVTGLTLQVLQQQIQAENPPIVLVNYKDINPAHPGNLGHFITLVGYNDAAFLAHDAYLLGANIRVSNEALTAAMLDVSSFAGIPNQGIVLA